MIRIYLYGLIVIIQGHRVIKSREVFIILTYMRHEALKGKTPAEKYGIVIEGENKCLT